MDDGADDADAQAAFAARYAGALDPRDARRWAQDPLLPSADGSESPGTRLERRRRALYRGAADPGAAEQVRTDTTDWERELALARAALEPAGTAGPRPPDEGRVLAPRSSAPHRRVPALRLALVVGALGVGAAVPALAARSAPEPAPSPSVAGSVAAGVPGVLVAQASAEHGARSGADLDGGGHFVTVVVTCQGDGGVEVRLSDGTDARFACIATFPRTVVQASTARLTRFGYTVQVTGTPDWAMTLSR